MPKTSNIFKTSIILNCYETGKNVKHSRNSTTTAANNKDKLRVLYARKNVWDYFGLHREDFLNLSEAKQLQLVRKFYFENLSSISKTNIDSNIGSAIRNSTGLSMTKTIESGNDRTEMTLSTNATTEEKPVKCINMWKNHGFFGTESCDFSIEKANMPENILFYINQGYQSYKDSKKKFTIMMST